MVMDQAEVHNLDTHFCLLRFSNPGDMHILHGDLRLNGWSYINELLLVGKSVKF